MPQGLVSKALLLLLVSRKIVLLPIAMLELEYLSDKLHVETRVKVDHDVLHDEYNRIRHLFWS